MTILFLDIYIVMFHKAKSEADRQQVFDAYMLSILKEKQVIKKNKKIIEEKDFNFDPTIDEDKVKGAFNTYVDRTNIHTTKD
jgi:hypothetical protein